VHWRRGYRDFRTTSPNRASVSSRGEDCPIVLIRLASCANKSLVPRIALIQWLVFALQAAVASRNRSLTTNLLCLDIFVPFSWSDRCNVNRAPTPRIFVVYSISGEVVLTSQAALMSAPLIFNLCLP